MKFDLIPAVDDGDGHVTNISLGQVARPEVSDMATHRVKGVERYRTDVPCRR